MTVPLTSQERHSLLETARRAIADHLAGRPRVSPGSDGIFARRSGAFVSLHNHGELRGCIGYPDGEQPLGVTVPSCAVSAATGDRRFGAVTPSELPEVDIEISVLTPVERVTDPADIEVGRDGLIVEQHGYRGLLLPQVATEWGWDRDEFLTQTCLKAGLPRDAWKRGASIFRFQAEVFGDK
jgi:AmmeMemoRadiSam system protein A